MIDILYRILQRIGYSHPVHPPATHLVIGLVVGGFLFSLAAHFFNRPSWSRTARHCFFLAMCALPIVIFLGILDWLHFFAGAWLFPIKMKLIFAGILTALLIVAFILAHSENPVSAKIVVVYALCTFTYSVTLRLDSITH